MLALDIESGELSKAYFYRDDGGVAAAAEAEADAEAESSANADESEATATAESTEENAADAKSGSTAETARSKVDAAADSKRSTSTAETKSDSKSSASEASSNVDPTLTSFKGPFHWAIGFGFLLRASDEGMHLLNLDSGKISRPFKNAQRFDYFVLNYC